MRWIAIWARTRDQSNKKRDILKHLSLVDMLQADLTKIHYHFDTTTVHVIPSAYVAWAVSKPIERDNSNKIYQIIMQSQ